MKRRCKAGTVGSLVAGLSFAILLGACSTPPAPVSERPVEEYRKAAPAPPAKPPPPSAAAAPAAASPKPAPAAESTAAPATSSKSTPPPPETAAAPATAPKPAPPAEAAGATAAAAPAAAAAPKTAAPKPAAGLEEGAEPDTRPEFYTVKRGDTLYSVALDAGLDYKDLAAWNQLDDPNVIKVGQQLRLRPPPGWKPDPADQPIVVRPVVTSPQVESRPLDAPPVKSGPKGIKTPYSEQALAQLVHDPEKPAAADAKPAAEAKPAPRTQSALATPPAVQTLEPAPAPAKAVAPVVVAKAGEPEGNDSQWMWPTAGPLLHGFDEGPNPKGVAIAGNVGQPIVASAAGKVVYSGSALRGYGKLIIIKHDNTYLSVYAHNRELLVKEGERVSKGQKIAEMGSLDSDQIGLHFEIRRQGKPVDPLKYLPPQASP